ncbi:reverse transcriptase domain-containing protein [Tanacetum coccineum]
MDEDELVPIILGWPFLSTTRAVINIHGGKLSLRVRSETVTFNIGKSMKSKNSRDDYLYCADHTAKLFQEQWVDTVNHDGKWTEVEEEEDSNEVQAVSFYHRTEPENNQLPVVISSALSTVEKAKLLEVLRNHKGAIAWSIANINGIESSFCTHKILMEDEFKPSVQPQRRVNLNIKEVVPKKEDLTVVKNEKMFSIHKRRSPDGAIRRKTTFIPVPLQNLNTNECLSDYAMLQQPFSANLEKMLKRCEETNLVLNWEKCHFMVKEEIVLGHKVLGAGNEVDKAKIEAISKLPSQPPLSTNGKSYLSFIGSHWFFRRFIKDFSRVVRPMIQLLVKDALFNFSEECIQAFEKLKRELTHAPIMIKPYWSLPFEVMCDAIDYAVGAVLGQRIDKHFKPIHYASKTMNKAQENYTTTEKELLAVVFAFDKFRQYLVLSKTIISQIILLYEFDIEIRDKKGAKNLVADHLPRLENPDLGKLIKAEIMDLFPKERLMAVFDKNNEPWHYFWDEPFLFKHCADQIIRRRVTGDEAAQILRQCYSGPSGGHHGITTTARKVFKAGFY